MICAPTWWHFSAHHSFCLLMVMNDTTHTHRNTHNFSSHTFRMLQVSMKHTTSEPPLDSPDSVLPSGLLDSLWPNSQALRRWWKTFPPSESHRGDAWWCAALTYQWNIKEKVTLWIIKLFTSSKDEDVDPHPCKILWKKKKKRQETNFINISLLLWVRGDTIVLNMQWRQAEPLHGQSRVFDMYIPWNYHLCLTISWLYYPQLNEKRFICSNCLQLWMGRVY